MKIKYSQLKKLRRPSVSMRKYLRKSRLTVQTRREETVNMI